MAYINPLVTNDTNHIIDAEGVCGAITGMLQAVYYVAIVPYGQPQTTAWNIDFYDGVPGLGGVQRGTVRFDENGLHAMDAGDGIYLAGSIVTANYASIGADSDITVTWTDYTQSQGGAVGGKGQVGDLLNG